MLAAILVVGAPQAGAACGDVPGNLIQNCGFDTDIAGWEVDLGVAYHRPDDGHSELGAIEMDSEVDNGMSRTDVRQCLPIAVTEPTVFLIAGYYRVPSPPAPDNECRVTVAAYPSTDCTQTVSDFLHIEDGFPAVTVDFIALEGTFMVQPDHGSIVLSLACLNAPGNTTPFVVRWDDAVLAPEIPLFSDGFENGDTSGWGTVVP